MRVKLAIPAAVCVVAMLAAVAYGATKPASTTLTIKGKNGDFHGRIESSRPHKCIDGRLVNVFKQKGSKQDPKTDQQIGSDTASLNGDHGTWSIGNSGFKSGRFYARAPKTDACKTGKSKTIHVGPSAAKTTVTIEGQNGDFQGTVDSPKLNRCADGRTIKVYMQTGDVQDPSADTEIGSDTSSLNGDHGEWSIGNSGYKSGQFYARAPKKSGCQAGRSDTITE